MNIQVILLCTLFTLVVSNANFSSAELFIGINENSHCDPATTCSSARLKLEDLIYPRVEDDGTDNYFRAAIYEHDRVDMISPRSTANANLDAYDKAASLAAANGSQIIVFPEDGLYDMPTRFLEEVIEEIPDPDKLDKDHNNPCNEPARFANNDILIRLSCMAKHNKLYVIANYGTREKCEPDSMVKTQKCPQKGQFNFNTNVVLGPDGSFLKRYRKWNLFIEAFERATDVETVYFDTPLGRFGIATCFDMLFKRPVIDLVESHKIDTLLFPTWWYDELPMLTALSTQEGWSNANGVNLIAANVHKPELGSVGSGIYSTNGDFIHTSSAELKPKLLIANLPKKPKQLPKKGKLDIDFRPVAIELDANTPTQSYKNLNFKLRSSDHIVSLDSISGTKTACSNEICCNADYEITQDSFKQDAVSRLKFVVRDTLRNTTFKWYEQICFLAELTTSDVDFNDPKKNIFAKQPTFKFHKLELTATFNTPHVFPIALHDVTKLISRADRSYKCQVAEPRYPDNPMYACEHAYRPETVRPAPVVSFGLYGRVYERDQIDYSKNIIKRWPDDVI